ncbi:hypothetical protein CAL7716_102340 (plasmid) [Calothrix sp. PCC 7716]|nr:hypothetical protein CAL7716_102340 [Calothrix sp. PCC 7716]
MIQNQQQWLDYTRWKSARWKTAIHRTKLSQPIKGAIARGIIHENSQLLDIGCGHRSDCNLLNQQGIKAVGFDPYYYPQLELIQPTEVISLNFVINVIECPFEREYVLKWAWELTKQWLIIAVQLHNPSKNRIGEIQTKKGTFQKYYTNCELTKFINSTIRPKYIKSKSGIVFIRK